MVFKNKQNIKDEIELRKTEEKISKKKAVMLFDTNKIHEIEVGTTKGLKEIHKYLFEDIYIFSLEKLEILIYQKEILDLQQPSI